uniref:PAZ domain-containing protein n=1 Tax=Ditylenchus dipsaci TaxID=166011 RepID=A0A915CQY4_9BILA
MPDNRNRRFVINGFSDNPVGSQMIDVEGQVISVATYYQNKYQLRIAQPHLPCVFNQQTPQLVEQMIRNCQALPKDFRRNNMTQVQHAHLQNNPYFQSHNIRMAGDLIVAKANVLFPPAIAYDQNQRDEPDANGLLNWKLGQRRFLRAAGTPKVDLLALFL